MWEAKCGDVSGKVGLAMCGRRREGGNVRAAMCVGGNVWAASVAR